MILGTISIISMLFFGGLQEFYLLQELEDGIKIHVHEEERKQEILAEIKASTSYIKSFNEQRKDELKLLKKINGDKNSTEVEFQAFHSNLVVERVEFQKKILEDRISITSKITQEEWDKIINGNSAFENKIDSSINELLSVKFQGFLGKVEELIPDTSREARVIALVEGLHNKFISINEKVFQMHEHQRPKILDKNSTLEMGIALNQEANKLSQEGFETLKQFHFDLAAELNDDEWKKLIKEFNKLLN